jgi:hypothetical protein
MFVKVEDLRKVNFGWDESGILICDGDHDAPNGCRFRPLESKEVCNLLDGLRRIVLATTASFKAVEEEEI